MAREYFPAYHSYLESMEELTDAEKGRLFTACLIYSKTGEAPQLSGNERYVFPTFRSQIDRDNAEYAKRCATNKKNGENGGKRTVPNGTERGRSLPNAPERPPFAPQEKEKEKEKEEEKGEYITPLPPLQGGKKKFSPPSVEEVRAYCLERNNSIDPASFVDFYTMKGWRVGKEPMKDWKAAIRTWERRKGDYTGTTQRSHGAAGPSDSARPRLKNAFDYLAEQSGPGADDRGSIQQEAGEPDWSELFGVP